MLVCSTLLLFSSIQVLTLRSSLFFSNNSLISYSIFLYWSSSVTTLWSLVLCASFRFCLWDQVFLYQARCYVPQAISSRNHIFASEPPRVIALVHSGVWGRRFPFWDSPSHLTIFLQFVNTSGVTPLVTWFPSCWYRVSAGWVVSSIGCRATIGSLFCTFYTLPLVSQCFAILLGIIPFIISVRMLAFYFRYLWVVQRSSSTYSTPQDFSFSKIL